LKSHVNKFNQMVIQESHGKALAAFIDAIAAIPRITLPHARIAKFVQSRKCECEVAAAGEVLMQQDEMSSVVMYIVSGSVCVVQSGEKRATIQAPAMFGHHSFIYRRARTAAIVCESRVVYIQVDLDDLLASASMQAEPSSPTASSNSTLFGHMKISPSPFASQPVDPSHIQAAPDARDASPSYAADRSFLNVAALAIAELEPAHFDQHNTTAPGRGLDHDAVRAQSSGQPPDNSSALTQTAALSSFVSAAPFISRGAGGMSVSDSLGTMLRQHHVRCVFMKFVAFHIRSRKPTPQRSLCLKP
jgi:hypothetical protein